MGRLAVLAAVVLAGCDPIVTVEGRVITVAREPVQFEGACIPVGAPWPMPPGAPVAAARVFALGTGDRPGEIGRTEARADGSFVIQSMGWDPREIRLRIEAPGFRTLDTTVRAISRRRFAVSVILAPDSSATPGLPDVSVASEAELRSHVGERVVLRGVFAGLGKQGPFVRFGPHSAYLLEHPKDGAIMTEYRDRWASLEHRQVTVTGTLRFSPAREGPPPPAPPMASIPDFYYFELESTQIEPAP
jgi:hypothetical protein